MTHTSGISYNDENGSPLDRALDERLKHNPTLQNELDTLFELPLAFAP